MKKYRKTMIITSLITVSPILIGLLLWNRLPEQLPTHFDSNGEVNGWSSKPFAVFGIPLFLLLCQWFCIFGMSYDPKKHNISDKMKKLVLWIVPVAALICNLSCYASALGIDVGIEVIVSALLGVLFILVGNYLPKSKQSYTVGIKLPWTLNNEENWCKTHRMAGWLWMAGGVVMFINAFLKFSWLPTIALFIMVLLPMIYSFLLYKKGN